MFFFKTKNPFKSTLVFGVLSVLSSGISLLLLPFFLNYLSPEDYGIISLVLIYSSIISVIGSLGLKSALFTFYFDFKEKDKLRDYLGNLFTAHLISFSLLTCFHVFFGDVFFELIFSSNKISFSNYGIVALLSVFFNTINSLYFVYLKNEVNIKIYFRYTLGLIVLTALFQIIFITQYNLKAKGLLLGSLIPNAIIFILISISNPYLFKLKLKKKLLYPSLNYSLKLLPFLLFFAFENQIDKYLIELNFGLKNVGLYSLLIKLFGLLSIVINAIDDGIRPFLYRDLQERKTTTNTYFNLYIGSGIFILVIINAIGYNLEHIIKNTEYLIIQKYIFLSSIAFLLILPIRFYGLLLVYYKESLKLSYTTCLKVIIMVLLMLILIPKYSIYGALYALVISNVINLLLFKYILIKRVNIIPYTKTVIFILLFIIGSFSLHYYLNSRNKSLFLSIYVVATGYLFIKLYCKDGFEMLKSKF